MLYIQADRESERDSAIPKSKTTTAEEVAWEMCTKRGTSVKTGISSAPATQGHRRRRAPWKHCDRVAILRTKWQTLSKVLHRGSHSRRLREGIYTRYGQTSADLTAQGRAVGRRELPERDLTHPHTSGDRDHSAGGEGRKG